MRSRLYIISVVAFFTLTSSECDDQLFFKKPQPENTKDQTGFYRKVQGTYLLLGRNFSTDEYFGLEPQDVREFVEILSGLLDLGILYTDSTWLKIEEEQIIRYHRQNLILEKQTFTDYMERLRQLNDLESLSKLMSTSLFTKIYKPDSIIRKNDVLCFMEDETLQLHHTENALYVIEDQDTVGEIIFSVDQAGSPVVSPDSIVRIVITDSALCVIGKDGITQEITFTDSTLYVFENGEPNGAVFYSENSLLLIDDKDTASYLVSGDQIDFILQEETDTLFNLSDNSTLRKLRGNYYLNFGCNKDSCNWNVYLLAPGHNGLSLSYINIATDLLIMKSITDVTELPHDRSTTYLADPTRREFLKFVREGGFSNTEEYSKMK